MSKVTTIAKGIRQGTIRALAKTITLVESRNPGHWPDAGDLLDNLLSDTGNSIRVGISGVPGVGKNKFIEAFGMYLISLGYKVVILAVATGAVILG